MKIKVPFIIEQPRKGFNWHTFFASIGTHSKTTWYFPDSFHFAGKRLIKTWVWSRGWRNIQIKRER